MWRQGVPVQQIAETVDRKPATIYKIAQAARAYVITGERPAGGCRPGSAGSWLGVLAMSTCAGSTVTV
jgi:hypothetical protein